MPGMKLVNEMKKVIWTKCPLYLVEAQRKSGSMNHVKQPSLLKNTFGILQQTLLSLSYYLTKRCWWQLLVLSQTFLHISHPLQILPHGEAFELVRCSKENSASRGLAKIYQAGEWTGWAEMKEILHSYFVSRASHDPVRPTDYEGIVPEELQKNGQPKT